MVLLLHVCAGTAALVVGPLALVGVRRERGRGAGHRDRGEQYPDRSGQRRRTGERQGGGRDDEHERAVGHDRAPDAGEGQRSDDERHRAGADVQQEHHVRP